MNIVTFSLSLLILFTTHIQPCAQEKPQQEHSPLAHFAFNNNLANSGSASVENNSKGIFSFAKGVDGPALSLATDKQPCTISFESSKLKLDNKHDFSIQFWINSSMERNQRAIFLSTKRIWDNSLAAQKQAGWSLGVNHGNLFWNIGSGSRRLTYERDNQNALPINDGKWHLISMTYSSAKGEVRLYFDGINRAIYKLNDGGGFEFAAQPLTLGWNNLTDETQNNILPAIKMGAEQLQILVDEFNKLGVGNASPDELIELVTGPEKLLEKKVETKSVSVDSINLELVSKARAALIQNPYTVHQVKSFMEVAPLLKIFALNKEGRIVINESRAAEYTQLERLYSPQGSLDELKIWDSELSHQDISAEYLRYHQLERADNSAKKKSLVAGVWNIFHGGKHFSVREHGWDSRLRIAEMLKKEGADVIMMQETYSSGDFIAAELGYYFATTADIDYLNQGSNISVMSRYPITEVFIPEGASFMNVAVRIAISDSQEVYVMSNWYGMTKFPDVYDFHKERFAGADEIPVLFAGDFNAVPHTDGGKSPASVKFMKNGFTDAFRSLYPDVKKYLCVTHGEDYRIDQLYYKGKSLKNIETKVISSSPEGFPSDHFLIISRFNLK